MKNQKRILAISDVHGNGHLLTKLLQAVNYSPDIDQLIMLGDYINKGPDSIGTLQSIESLCKEGAIALAGNNELKWLNSENSETASWKPFLKSLPFYKEISPFIFVHAGIKKSLPLYKQRIEDLTGINTPSFECFPDRIVVFGHTPTFRLASSTGQVWLKKGMVGIDTGAGHGSNLSLVDLTNWLSYFVRINNSEEVNSYPLQKQIVYGDDYI
ncbi:metallophosphoesterase [Oceanobacillus sojae]|uniref:metallophosphoesterase n=1 Tax=Oceanobacillus sojae TaxID=582851 RepID=UPI0036407411